MAASQSETQVDKFILGCAQLGLDYGIANTTGQPDESTAFELLNTAYEKGIRTLDTAVAYGTSQQVIGKHFQENPDQSWTVVTKVTGKLDGLDEELESIQQLFLSEPDVILFHSALDSQTSDQVLKKVGDAFPKSKLGISVYESDDVSNALKLFQPQFIQLPFSLFDQRMDRSGVLQKLSDVEIQVHVRSVFMQGAMFMGDSEFAKRFPSAIESRQQLLDIASRREMSLAELSLAFALSHPHIHGVLIGAESPDQLLPHVATASKELDIDTLNSIQSVILDDPQVVDPRQW